MIYIYNNKEHLEPEDGKYALEEIKDLVIENLSSLQKIIKEEAKVHGLLTTNIIK